MSLTVVAGVPYITEIYENQTVRVSVIVTNPVGPGQVPVFLTGVSLNGLPQVGANTTLDGLIFGENASSAATTTTVRSNGTNVVPYVVDPLAPNATGWQFYPGNQQGIVTTQVTIPGYTGSGSEFTIAVGDTKYFYLTFKAPAPSRQNTLTDYTDQYYKVQVFSVNAETGVPLDPAEQTNTMYVYPNVYPLQIVANGAPQTIDIATFQRDSMIWPKIDVLDYGYDFKLSLIDPTGRSVVDESQVIWSNDDSNVMTVTSNNDSTRVFTSPNAALAPYAGRFADSNGCAFLVGDGSTFITATYNGINYKSAQFIIQNPAISMSISGPGQAYVTPGVDTVQFSAAVTYANGKVVDPEVGVTWTNNSVYYNLINQLVVDNGNGNFSINSAVPVLLPLYSRQVDVVIQAEYDGLTASIQCTFNY